MNDRGSPWQMAAHLLTRATVGVGVGLLSLVVPAAAQDKVWRLGLLSAGPQAQAPGTQSSWRSGVLASLERKGFRVGTNLELVDRYAGGNLSRMPSLAREIAAAKVDVVVAITDPAVKAMLAANKTTPIVMVVGADPVELGLVASLAHPGGRVTGIAFQTFEGDVKRLQFLREAMPVARRFGYLWPPGPIPVRMVDALTQAARRLNIELTMRSVAALDEVVGNPHLRAREMFVPVRVGDSEIEVFGSPLELSRSPVRTRGVAPTPGQHNREVYVEWLGMSTERFESLRAGGIV